MELFCWHTAPCMSNTVVIHLGCLTKLGGFRQAYVLTPITQLCHLAQGTDMKLLKPLPWMPFLPEVMSSFLRDPFLSAYDERVGWQAEHNHAWAQGSWKGFFCGDAFCFHTPASCMGALQPLWVIQTITSGLNASTTLQDFIICQLVSSP